MDAKRYTNMNSAYIGVIQDIFQYGELVDSVTDPMSIGSNFGSKKRVTKEIMAYSFSIMSPADRAVFLPSRRINLPFAIANCIWTMTGSDSLDFISFYNERGRQFSDDRETLHGAHGKRLFDSDGINQIVLIMDRIKKDLYSRRTVGVIYQPGDNKDISRDIPCPIAIQFLQRNGKLNAITFMRSQSALMVFPYDIFLFTFMQEVLAIELGLGLGTYHHMCGSFHYYLDEESLVQELIESPPLLNNDIPAAPQMPKTPSPFEMINVIARFENNTRKHIQELHRNEAINIPDLPQYWQDLTRVLAIKIANEFGIEKQKYIDVLPEYYARYFGGRQYVG